MCTAAYHDDLQHDWIRFEGGTLAGFVQKCAGFVFEMRNCRVCGSSLSHPRDRARYGIR
jgi:hypothetical protein